ncbi:MAG: sensor histidine kinase [Wujia sp.]
MKRVINKFVEFEKRLKIKQRMFLVYLIGCIVPLLLVYFHMYNSTKNALVLQELTNENEKLEAQVNDITNSMALAEEFSRYFYYDSENEKLVMSSYNSSEKISVDFRNYDELWNYVSDYYPEIADISVYLYEGHFDNRRFKFITETIENKNWFMKAKEKNGLPYWSYSTNIQTGVKSLRMTKTLLDENRNPVGMICFNLNSNITSVLIDRDDATAMMLFEDMKLMQSNVSVKQSDLEFLYEKVSATSFNGWINYNGEKCVASRAFISPRYGDESYCVIIIKTYKEVIALARQNAMEGLIPLLLSTIIATIAVICLSDWFSKRINSFRLVMHEAAIGNFKVRNTEIGDVRDEIWELNEDLNQMIEDIQKLMETAVNERVQKEQLYSRQKDVEFKMLATQINPHFLYNTLENVRMLARINKQTEIEDISVNLTKLLRRSLNVGQNLKPLRWEMEVVEYYIRIQDYRFGDRISATITYDKDMADKYMLIPFIIQPFVENAYVHAMEDMDSGGHIDVRVVIDESKLLIYVEDNGHGMSEKKLEEITRYINDFENLDRTHIGICNVNQRIKLKFGMDYGVIFTSTENVGTKVEIRMPLIDNL